MATSAAILLVMFLNAPSERPLLPGESARDRRADPLELNLFVRPELDALRVRNDGTRTLTCGVTLSGGASLRSVYLGPGQADIIAYSRFDGLDPNEGFSRARNSVSIECVDPNGQSDSAVYRQQ